MWIHFCLFQWNWFLLFIWIMVKFKSFVCSLEIRNAKLTSLQPQWQLTRKKCTWTCWIWSERKGRGIRRPCFQRVDQPWGGILSGSTGSHWSVWCRLTRLVLWGTCWCWSASSCPSAPRWWTYCPWGRRNKRWETRWVPSQIAPTQRSGSKAGTARRNPSSWRSHFRLTLPWRYPLLRLCRNALLLSQISHLSEVFLLSNSTTAQTIDVSVWFPSGAKIC